MTQVSQVMTRGVRTMAPSDTIVQAAQVMEEMDVGVLFADVRDFTTLSEHRSPKEVADLLNAFYESAIEVVCRHAIVDKLVGDEVMGLYLPDLFGKDVGADMLADARELLDTAGPLLEIGVGLDYGRAYVGNVGAGEVKDFTAIGDVVNTASRLQSVAGAGQAFRQVREQHGGQERNGDPRAVDERGAEDERLGQAVEQGAQRDSQAPALLLIGLRRARLDERVADEERQPARGQADEGRDRATFLERLEGQVEREGGDEGAGPEAHDQGDDPVGDVE